MTTVCAVFFSVVGLAVRGNAWAMGVSAGVVSLAVLAVCGTVLFSMVWIASGFMGRFRGREKPVVVELLDKGPAGGKPLDSPFAQSPADGSSQTSKPSGPPGATLVLFFLLAISNTAFHARAQQIEPWRITGGNVSANGAGLRMSVDSRWMTSGGYRPVRVTFMAPTPLKADRSLSVDLIVAANWYRGSSQLTVTEDFKIPAGSSSISKVISLPELVAWNQFKIHVYEDEELVKPLSKLTINQLGRNAANWQFNQVWGETPGILFVGDKLPDTSEMSLHFGSPADLSAQGIPIPQSITGKPNMKMKVPIPSALAVAANELPTSWIDYTGLDVVCLSLKQLGNLKNKQPRSFKAITAWTAAGGNLWVYGVGSNWERIDELERLLEIPDSDKKKNHTMGWIRPRTELFGREMKKEQTRRYYGNPTNLVYDKYSPQSNRAPKAPKTPASPHFVCRDLDMGMVVALKDGKPFPGTRWQWGWLLNATGPDRWAWNQRHGISFGGGNGYFLNFRIPGVGLAPVGAFRVLLTFFVLAIGPLNYIVLRRARRLNLLVVTIPAGAILVTAGLFAYALVADGLSTRVRMRSATVIDQDLGRAVCWNRLCYYAGMAPSRGLTFPEDVAVIPIESPASYNSRHVRELFWDDEQWMSEGWLDARTLTQFLTLRSRPCTAGLDFKPSPTGGKEIEVQNNLGTAIELLLVCMSDGKYYEVQNVEQDATATANEVAAIEAFAQLEQRARKTNPKYPQGMRNLRSFYPGANLSSVSSNSFLERKLACRMLHKPSNAIPTGPDQNVLQPCSYVAIVARSPEAVAGLDGRFKDAGSFHVVFGSWREEETK